VLKARPLCAKVMKNKTLLPLQVADVKTLDKTLDVKIPDAKTLDVMVEDANLDNKADATDIKYVF